jgi:hypothetical protein
VCGADAGEGFAFGLLNGCRNIFRSLVGSKLEQVICYVCLFLEKCLMVFEAAISVCLAGYGLFGERANALVTREAKQSILSSSRAAASVKFKQRLLAQQYKSPSQTNL